MKKYRLISKRGEGTFSEVIKAQNTKTGKLLAIKCMKSSYKSADEVHSLREIQAIKRLTPHPNIVTLEEVLFDPQTGRLALVFELMEGNLYELMKNRQEHLNEANVKSFMRQIITSLDHMHRRGIFHRDIKPENILFDATGKNLKLADFGSCRGINGKPPFTEYISTRWYRPPECLLTCGMYGPEMDVWGAGCILFELTTLYPLFPGTDEVDQINRIHRVLGTPEATVLAKLKKYASSQANFHFPQQKGIGLSNLLPEATQSFLDLLARSVAYDASSRITSSDAMLHPYFSNQFTRDTLKISDEEKVDPVLNECDFQTPLPASSSVPPGLSNAESSIFDPSMNENKQNVKPRSMVSILLARNDKKSFIQESQQRNKTFYRKKKDNPTVDISGSLKAEKAITKNLPKLKPLHSEHKSLDNKVDNIIQEQKPHLKHPKKYAHIRSTGYGAFTSTSKQEKELILPSSNPHAQSLGKKNTAKRLPPIIGDTSKRMER